MLEVTVSNGEGSWRGLFDGASFPDAAKRALHRLTDYGFFKENRVYVLTEGEKESAWFENAYGILLMPGEEATEEKINHETTSVVYISMPILGEMFEVS